jgi:sarcosine oxidase, subunit beta
MIDALPSSCEVVVVGAGVTGLSAAFHLAGEGAGPILVVDRVGIAAEASGVQPGGVRQQWNTRINCLLARESVDFFRNFSERVEADVQPKLEACGYIFLAHSEAALAQLKAGVAVQNEVGVASVILSAEQAAEVVPDLSTESILGAAWCGEDGYFDRPQGVVEAFAQAAERRGVMIGRATVASLQASGSGWKVCAEDGRVIDAERVLLTTGYDTQALVSSMGIDLPIQKEPRHLLLSEPIRERLLEPLVVSAERAVAAKQLASGRVLIGDLSVNGSTDAADERRRVVRGHVEELLPRLQYISLPLLVEGFYDVTPDHQPVIDELAGGVWVAAGFSGHGFMLSPAIGRRLALALAGRPEDDVLSAFSLARFDSNDLDFESAIV